MDLWTSHSAKSASAMAPEAAVKPSEEFAEAPSQAHFPDEPGAPIHAGIPRKKILYPFQDPAEGRRTRRVIEKDVPLRFSIQERDGCVYSNDIATKVFERQRISVRWLR